jgi:hypothetical protein
MGLRFVIRDWDQEKRIPDPGFRVKKGTRSWIRIRNTAVLAGPYSEQPSLLILTEYNFFVLYIMVN